MSWRRPANEQSSSEGTKSKTEPLAPCWLDPPVDTFGWDTDIPRTRKIHKSYALSEYQLDYANLDDLSYNVENRSSGVGKMHMYKEYEVEWVAWKVHGGPDGLWYLLRELRDKSLQSGSQTRFFLPYSYCPGRRFDLNRSTAPLCDRYLMNNHVMIAAKDALPAWFWISCNLALNRALSSGALPGRGASASVERVYAMRAACKFFNEHRARYASRPAAPIASARVSGGEELDLLPKFRLWLGCAPRISGNSRDMDAWGPPNCKDGLVFGSGGYEWDAEYLEELFRQLCGLVDALGLGDDGWRSLRWEVYHQYAMSVDGGLCYDACGRFWSDPAAVWLEGQIVPDPAPDSMRGRCAEGLRYNGLLEVMSAVDNVRTTGSFGSSGNGNTSPVRVPSQAAGPSLA